MLSEIEVFLGFLWCGSDWAQETAVTYFYLFSVTHLWARVDSGKVLSSPPMTRVTSGGGHCASVSSSVKWGQ